LPQRKSSDSRVAAHGALDRETQKILAGCRHVCALVSSGGGTTDVVKGWGANRDNCRPNARLRFDLRRRLDWS
jgi:hypothetical protein